ncbi:HINT (histidine triad nucleotide-binding protein) family member [Metamycoplasma arthritidis]|uniref:HINT (Histidine triad nucleotide-binding protein) family member n=1 Tax=Metamycoplasma arthritidis (strain 158L3-1) TaxID=243272 RepID=B3PM11_META1|nr:HIT domain-containing protein [Metamycoplasma arthritidis]ACF07063.1 HINT (histidine triad nucleotide-binding protein) family member [Metamycoplasma arthritidis 158L3-1]VEU78591.1 HINT (histidine triad nucleotide-binding protein) family member [Metamycoplasma arthritidis]
MEKDTFQRIIDREIPATIIYEDDKVIAFMDIKPVNKGHFLVVSKEFSRNLIDIEEDDLLELTKKARELAVSQMKKLGATGFRFIVNNNESAGQVIFRTHIHIIPYYD